MNGIQKLAVAALFAASLPAGAASWNTSTPGIGLSSTIYCGTNTCATTTGTLTGPVITMTAYSTGTQAAVGANSPVDTGQWYSAQLAIYSGGGIGITNSKQTFTSDATSPQHGIDNYGVNDILVVDFGSTGWDVSSFSTGYTCAMATSGTSCAGSNVNFDAWVGNAAPNTATGFGAGGTLSGFNALTITPDVSGTGTRTETTSFTGRYLVITGSLAGYADAFKLSGIVASTGGGGGTGVPEIGTLPLLALGFVAAGLIRRRKTAA